MSSKAQDLCLDPAYEKYYEPAAIALRSYVLKGQRTFIITSSWEGAGKTTATLYLGRILAVIGLRTLLIDGDFFRANLSRQTSLVGPGLPALGTKVAPKPQNVLGLSNLQAVGPGSLEKAQPEAVEWISAHPSLQTMIKDYDLALIDTPPLSASNDALMWGKQADGCIMVFSKKTWQARAESKLVKQLGEEGIPILGMILTRDQPQMVLGQQKSTLRKIASWLGLQA
jgi:Mrp family chromosome partitioning ATPase